jgi:hypothetical protein
MVSEVREIPMTRPTAASRALARTVYDRRLSPLPLSRLEREKPSTLARMIRRADKREAEKKGDE